MAQRANAANKYDDALAAFKKSIELDANYYPALNGAGICLLNRYLMDKDDTARPEALGPAPGTGAVGTHRDPARQPGGTGLSFP